jgi:hypothetical protein
MKKKKNNSQCIALENDLSQLEIDGNLLNISDKREEVEFIIINNKQNRKNMKMFITIMKNMSFDYLYI